jgi:hypothetical protein
MIIYDSHTLLLVSPQPLQGGVRGLSEKNDGKRDDFFVRPLTELFGRKLETDQWKVGYARFKCSFDMFVF